MAFKESELILWSKLGRYYIFLGKNYPPPRGVNWSMLYLRRQPVINNRYTGLYQLTRFTFLQNLNEIIFWQYCNILGRKNLPIQSIDWPLRHLVTFFLVILHEDRMDWIILQTRFKIRIVRVSLTYPRDSFSKKAT